MKLPDKSSAADPLSVPLLKQIATDIAPILLECLHDRANIELVQASLLEPRPLSQM